MMLGMLLRATDNKESMAAKTMNIILVFFILALVVASFLISIKLSSGFESNIIRASVVLLAVLYPDLFILGYLIFHTPEIVKLTGISI